MSAAIRHLVLSLVALLFVGIGSTIICISYADLATARTPDRYEEEIVAFTADGKPPDTKAPTVNAPVPSIETGTNLLSNVPAFDWSYGCSSTSAAMLFGYYDRTGYGNMYAGPTNTGVCPLDNSIWGETVYPSITCHECPLSATHIGVDGRAIKGHVDDYWIDYLDAGPDPYIGNWAEHAQGDCTADFMGTSQSKLGCDDGATAFYFDTEGDPVYDFTIYEPDERDGCHGMRLFAESRGYSVAANFNQLILGQGSDSAKGFTFSQYVAEIDAGRPVLIHITGHTMLGYGYDTTGEKVYLRDTWDHSSHVMTWGSTYEGLQQKGVTVIRLGGLPSVATTAASSVTSGSATLNGELTSLGMSSTVYVSFRWGVSPGGPYPNETAPLFVENPGTFSQDLDNLNAETTYYYTAKAEGNGPAYGGEESFKTDSPTVTISTSGLPPEYPATVRYVLAGVPSTATTCGTWSNKVDCGTTVSIESSVAVSATERYGTGAATSWSATQTATHIVPYYRQFKTIASAVTTGTGHTDMDSTNHAAMTYCQYGSEGVHDMYDNHTFGGWVDAGSTISLSNPSSGSTSTRRWYCPGQTSWVVNSAGTLSATYWDQFKPAISVTTAGDAHADLDAENSVTLTCYQCGAARTFSLFDAQDFIDWVDRGSVASLNDSSSGSTETHRWYCPDTPSWTMVGASSFSATYWDQFRPDISVTTAGPDHTDLAAANCVTLTYRRWGVVETSSLFDGQGFNGWMDTGSAVGLSKTSSGSAETHRWYCSQATSWTVDGASSHSATYWDQLKPSISVITSGNGHTDLDSTNCAILSWRQSGVGGTFSIFDRQSFKDWVDKGSTVNLSNPSTGSTSTHRWYSIDTTSWVITDTRSRSATYYEQYLLAITNIAGLDSSHPTTITFARDGATCTAAAVDSWTDWADTCSTVSLSKSVEGGWIGDWSTGDVTDWIVAPASSYSIRYERSYAGLYALMGGLLAAAAIIALTLLVVIHMRRRGYALRDLPDYLSDHLG